MRSIYTSIFLLAFAAHAQASGCMTYETFVQGSQIDTVKIAGKVDCLENEDHTWGCRFIEEDHFHRRFRGYGSLSSPPSNQGLIIEIEARRYEAMTYYKDCDDPGYVPLFQANAIYFQFEIEGMSYGRVEAQPNP